MIVDENMEIFGCFILVFILNLKGLGICYHMKSEILLLNILTHCKEVLYYTVFVCPLFCFPLMHTSALGNEAV